MKTPSLTESLILVVLLALAYILIDPMQWFMPTMIQMAALAGLVAAFAVLATFLVREQVRDEREEQLRSSSGRIGFLLGAGVLVVAIVVQGYMHMLDHWLVYALLAMVFGKVAARIYTE